MSVLLDGKATAGVELCEWQGVWYYCKEKGISLPYKYVRTGDMIPKDLLEYVSFYTAAPANRGIKKGVGRGGRTRRTMKNRLLGTSGRKRGRPPLTSQGGTDGDIPEVGTASASANVGTDGVVNDTDNDDDEDGGDDNDADGDGDVDSGVDGDMKGYGDGDGEEGIGDGVSSTVNDGVDVGKMIVESGLPNAIKEAARGLPATLIPREHPLFGVWEGSFDVAEASPLVDHQVPETFFFHSFLGVSVLPAFTCLPAHAHYTYSALRSSPSPLLPPLLMLEMSVVNGSSRDKVEGDGSKTSTEFDNDNYHHDVATLITKAVSVQALDSTPAKIKLEGGDSAASIPAAVPAPGDPDAVTDGSGSSSLIVMVGFGRNNFGRFSLTATFDRSTGSMIAEKRYIQSKSATTQRKGRKSHDPADMDPMTTRPKNNSIDMGSIGGLPGRRKRNGQSGTFHRRGSEDFAYGDDEEFYGMGSSSSNHKRTKHPASSSSSVVSQSDAPAAEAEQDPDDDVDYRGATWDEFSGEIYEGGWRASRRNGSGLVLYADGSMYEGQWVNGKEHGHGQLMTSDRKVLYSGEWMEGLMHGPGSYNFFSGDRYVGDWREGNRHGKGEFLTREGCKYVGDWKENRRSGRGLFTWPDGSTYDGEWEEDSRHGKGILKLSSGFEYEGLWSRNFFQGRGVAVFPNGQKYEGSYNAGLREGRGSITFPEGAIYEGRFRDDRLDGQGTIKVTHSVPGAEEGEIMVPIEIQADMRRIHLKAGFGEDHGHH